jgi:hypothetical protein
MIDSPPSAGGTAAAPGWYPDPAAVDMLRWWDGDEWSDSDFKLAPRRVRTRAIATFDQDAAAPPSTEGRAKADWYPDPASPEILRWWDGNSWSATDFKPDGEDGYPWWHSMHHRQLIRSALETLIIKAAARAWWR